MFQSLFQTKQTRRPFIISIEGNIGAGKSTILEHLKRAFVDNGINAVFMPEPVDVWNTVVDEHGETILSKYYADPAKYSFSFQIMAYTTRLQILQNTVKNNPNCDVIVCERSLEADNHIFAQMLFDDGLIEHVNYNIYKMIYENTSGEYATDGIVYMYTHPEKCLERVHRRQRDGEGGIAVEYLDKCHRYYENWLHNEYVNKQQVFTIDANTDVVYGEDAVAAKWIQQIIGFICVYLGEKRANDEYLAYFAR